MSDDNEPWALIEQRHKLLEDNTALKERIKALEGERDQYKNEAEMWDENCQTLNHDLDHLRQDNERLKGECGTLAKYVGKLEADLQSHKSCLEVARSLLDEVFAGYVVQPEFIARRDGWKKGIEK